MTPQWRHEPLGYLQVAVDAQHAWTAETKAIHCTQGIQNSVDFQTLLPCTGLAQDVSKATHERKRGATLGHQALVGAVNHSSCLTALPACANRVDPRAVVSQRAVHPCRHTEFALGHILANHVAAP